MTPKH